MKHLHIIFVIAILMSSVYADDTSSSPTNASPAQIVPPSRHVKRRALVSFRVSKKYLDAGESFALYLNESGAYFVVHTVYGSGIPVLSTATYDVKTVKRGKRTDYEFESPHGENQYVTFTIEELDSNYTLYLFDREINAVITKE